LSLPRKRESRSMLQRHRKTPRTRRSNRLNAPIDFWHENEQFYGDSDGPIVDLRFKRICGPSANPP
jgi:hypothetical protein